MTDNEEINARLLAERNARQGGCIAKRIAKFQQEWNEQMQELLDRAESLAMELHRWWSEKDFAEILRGDSYVHWLDVEDGEKLAHLVRRDRFDKYYTRGSRPEHSGIYVMIDGRLVRTIGYTGWYDEGSWYSDMGEFDTLRDYAKANATKGRALVEQTIKDLEALHKKYMTPGWRR
jgi:hypothetical protein